MSTKQEPFVSFSHAELEKAPAIKAGDEITCRICGGRHVVKPSGVLLFYKCEETTFLGGVAGKSVLK
jgi:hypothetical protein